MRSTLGPTVVNEVRSGWQWSPNEFFANVNAGMYENQGGFRIDFPTISDPTVANHNAPAPRNTVNWSVDNTLSWLKGAHSFSFGGSFMQVTHNQNNANVVPTIGIRRRPEQRSGQRDVQSRRTSPARRRRR